MDRYSSDDQIGKDMEEQHQLPYQVQALQIAGCIEEDGLLCRCEISILLVETGKNDSGV